MKNNEKNIREILKSIPSIDQLIIYSHNQFKITFPQSLLKKIIKRLAIIKSNSAGPSLENLLEKYNKTPNDINLVLEISDNFFSNKKYEEAFSLLIEKYPKNKEKVKKKMLDFFEALGGSHETTIFYRKKLSSIMFS